MLLGTCRQRELERELTGVFIVALYKATEKIWEKSFDATWAPVDEALTRAGRADPARLEQARLIFERMLGYANHLGLYAEETGSRGEALGNFPQAFTHLSLISAAFNLDRALGKRN